MTGSQGYSLVIYEELHVLMWNCVLVLSKISIYSLDTKKYDKIRLVSCLKTLSGSTHQHHQYHHQQYHRLPVPDQDF